MPAALPFPIGSRFYDWKYETDPEPDLGGRRVFHARGKVLGGSSSINGMIFQRGNPLDYERWAAEPGMKEWDYLHCLPYFKRMENCLAGADEWRGGDGPLKLERGPATNPLFDAFFQARRSRPATTSPTTSTATARRASRGSTATSTAAAGSPRRGPTSTRSGTGRTSPSATLALVTRVRFDGKRAVGVDYERARRASLGRRRRGDPLRRRDQHPAAACSCPASATRRC